MEFPNPFEWKYYNYLVIIPILAIIFSVFFLIPNIPQGIDLKGGLLLTVYTNEEVDAQALKAALASYSDAEVRAFGNAFGQGVEIELPVDADLQAAEEELANLHDLDGELSRAEVVLSYYQQAEGEDAVSLPEAQANVTRLTGEVLDSARFVIESSGGALTASTPHEAAEEADAAFDEAKSGYRDNLLAAVSSVMKVDSYSFKEIGASLSRVFFSKVQEVLVWSFLLSTIVVFFIFRSLVPSLAVIFAAVADIVITAGLMSVFNIPLSLASVAALLMLVGFSLDTDALLTVRVYKRSEGTARDRAFDAMKTAVMMNGLVMASFGVLALIALYLQIPTYYQIGAVAFIGSAVDFVATWTFNAGIILWDADRRGIK